MNTTCSESRYLANFLHNVACVLGYMGGDGVGSAAAVGKISGGGVNRKLSVLTIGAGVVATREGWGTQYTAHQFPPNSGGWNPLCRLPTLCWRGVTGWRIASWGCSKRNDCICMTLIHSEKPRKRSRRSSNATTAGGPCHGRAAAGLRSRLVSNSAARQRYDSPVH